jgi:hypothetical protein
VNYLSAAFFSLSSLKETKRGHPLLAAPGQTPEHFFDQV